MKARTFTTKDGVEFVNFNPQKIWDVIGEIMSDKYSNEEYEVKITYTVRPKQEALADVEGTQGAG